MNLTDRVYSKSPVFIQNLLITLYSYFQSKKRYGEKYIFWMEYYKSKEFSSKEELILLQENRFKEFLKYVYSKSSYYKHKYVDIDIDNISINNISKLPILQKEELRANVEKITTVDKSNCYISRTGGTTGKSLTVFFDWDDFQERMALLDIFRNRFLHKDNPRYGWFSGKDLLGSKKRIYWRTDYISRIRYYSTFHINRKTIKAYIDDINKYKPTIFVGFPSSMVEIAKYGLANSMTLSYIPQAIFPTAETIVADEVVILKSFFGCGVYNQYASSEGAPFITECEKGELHYEMLSGVIEVIDENGDKSNTGEILVTAFATRGTPLIRYKIEDSVTLKDGVCTCGRNTPLVESIDGRINDFIYSEERGKINLGNISNCVKYTNGIIKFQIIQDSISEIEVKLITDPSSFKKKDEDAFIYELRSRLGENIKIMISHVNYIDRETSGKFRIVKSSLSL